MTTLSFGNYRENLAKYQGQFPVDLPEFIKINPDLNNIKNVFAPYRKYKNIIVIGNGGSISTLLGLWGATPGRQPKWLTIVPTMEPDYLLQVQKDNPPEQTLVVVISKSGDTVGVLESLMAFKNYSVLVITTNGQGTLFQLAQKMNWPVVEHPVTGGRFAGRSAVAYGPAYLLDLDTDEIETGAQAMISQLSSQKNTAWRLAVFMWEAEKAGYSAIFMPVYSHYLVSFNQLVTQLMHESAGKEKKGELIFGIEAPESQHHTNQLFFGGPRKMAGLFITTQKQNQDIKIEVQTNAKEVALRDNKLEMLNGESLTNALLCEAQGTMEDTKQQNIPFAHLQIDQVKPKSLGEYTILWQMAAYYSAILRDVNPLDQPQVEKSKQISFEIRIKKY